MKKHIWIVIAVVLVFIGMIIVYSTAPTDSGVAGDAATDVEKSN